MIVGDCPSAPSHDSAQVKPGKAHLSGPVVRPQDLRGASNFKEVQTKMYNMLKGRKLVGHALRNDLKVLLLDHPKQGLTLSSLS